MGCCNSKDMAICLVIFNPTKSKKLISNYWKMIEKLEPLKLPVFTLELVFNDNAPELPNAFHVHGSSYMFHKERLCRLLEERVPKQFKKLAFMDADLVYDDPKWYSETSKLLNSYDVVQMFEDAHWMNNAFTEPILRRKSTLFMEEKIYNHKHHPGFAWAFRREWYNKVGYFDWAISGSGDTLSSAKWLMKTLPANFQSLPKPMFREYIKFFDKPTPKITYLKGIDVFHLYHGSRKNRQYTERHKLLDTPEDIRALIKINKEGVYEWRDKKKWNPIFFKYFMDRKDDEDDEIILEIPNKSSPTS